MFYLIYKITNLINNKVYIGKHKTTDINDSYMGSGKVLLSAIQKYGIENFSKEILFIFQSEDEMNQKEKEIVNEDFVSQNCTYNLTLGGNGGFYYINSSGIAKFKGKTHTDETKRRISEASSGRFHSNKTKEILRKKSIENNSVRYTHQSGKNLLPKTAEIKEKISKALSDVWANRTELEKEVLNKKLESARSKRKYSKEWKDNISRSVKKAWDLRTRSNYPYDQIKIDINQNMRPKEIREKYNLSKNQWDYVRYKILIESD